MNKLSGEKTTNHISFVKKYLPFEGDFFMLEDFLLANPLCVLRVAPKVEGDSANTNFVQSDVNLFVRHQADMKNCTLLSVLLKDMMLKQQMDVTFENYLKAEFGNFSTKRTINIKRGEQNIKISAEIYKYSPASGLEFPFW